MNVKAMFHRLWSNHALNPTSHPSGDRQVVPQNRDAPPPAPGSNVIVLQPQRQQPSAPDSQPSGNTPRRDEDAPAPKRIAGLMNTPELERFFQENHFGLGRHNGANYRSNEALELGKRSLIARFQNVIGELIARREQKRHKLQLELIGIEGISPTMSAQLRLAGEQLQKEVALLERQVTLAESGQGWVLDALNHYQIGFNKGLREAIEFELLDR